ncbi:site-specific integrase [Clostridium perfringens]|nr:site-specific integrase [Clostridium perfringens]MDM0759074.1 site-specific integrase [Clostridium perfringens]HBI7033948.1 site-specific integrase [Clostridium perfringens]HBI7048034.1 site-specific integrase [Clostridium perfringens]HBI7053212.1 site-specific integrase [Clostridium perfringens]
MNYVEPIRDSNKVHEIANYLRRYSERNYIMFILGINSGLRISDILSLRVRDVKGKEYFYVREKKTKKQRRIPMTPVLKRELKEYCKNKELDDFIIKSQQGYNQPISRVRAYTILRDAGETLGLYNLGTHTLRKTFGYHFYMQYKDIVTLQKIFNHSDPSITLHYIGVEQSHINKMIKAFKI